MKKNKFSLIYLAYGQGSRFDPHLPKQYHLMDKQILGLYSLKTLMQMDVFSEIVIVCHKEFVSIFPQKKNILFTEGGEKRQDSVRIGFEKLTKTCEYVCIHDAARPYTHEEDIRNLLETASHHSSCALASKATDSIKVVDENNCVIQTLDRKKIVQMQTPQILRYSVLKEGLAYIQKNNLVVTDDVQMAELLHYDVKIVESKHNNAKITYLRDLPCTATK
jgi:2-C-methyl-D-erythritol 4-phosphate cytidylyltransferase